MGKFPMVISLDKTISVESPVCLSSGLNSDVALLDCILWTHNFNLINNNQSEISRIFLDIRKSFDAFNQEFL